MVAPGGLGGEIADDIAARQLSGCHGDELRPTADLAQFTALVMAHGQGLEFMSRDQFE